MIKSFYVILTATVGLLLSLFSIYFLQLCGYKCKLGIKAVKAIEVKMGVAIGCAYALCFCWETETAIIRLALLVFAEMLGIWNVKKKRKVSFVYTARVMRIMCVSFCLGVAVAVIFNPAVLIVSLFLPLLSTVILLPTEKIIGNKYIKRARKAYEKVPIKVCITGSYGKTTVKNMCKALLEKDYCTMVTPLSYNTPLGLARASKSLTGKERIAVIEMGARKRGDIRELCDIAEPSVGVITGLAPQHLESFGSLKNIAEEKLSLYTALRDKYAFIYNADDFELVTAIKERGIEGLSCGFNGSFVNAVKTEDGYNFTVGGKVIKAKPRLLGKHNISNLCLAIGVAHIMKVQPERIIERIEKIEPSPHRLSYEERQGVLIIDDSYNCNIKGAAAACDTLKELNRRAFVITAGIVEGGREQGELNREIGRMLSKVAFGIYAVGVNADYIAEGAKEFGKETIKCKSLTDAVSEVTSLFKKGDVLLFMNDLTDNFI